MILLAGLRLLSTLCAAPHIAVVIADAVATLIDPLKVVLGDTISPYSLWLRSLCARVQRGPMPLKPASTTTDPTPFALPLLPVQTENGIRHADHQLAMALTSPIPKSDILMSTSATVETNEMSAVTAQDMITRVRRAAADGRLVHFALESIVRACVDTTPIPSVSAQDAPATIRRAAAMCAYGLSAAESTALEAKVCAAHALHCLRSVDWRVTVTFGLAARVGVDMPLSAVGKELLVDHQTILRQSFAVDEVRCCRFLRVLLRNTEYAIAQSLTVPRCIACRSRYDSRLRELVLFYFGFCYLPDAPVRLCARSCLTCLKP